MFLSPSVARAQSRRGSLPADSVLTVDAFTQLRTFWTAFSAEPDSIRGIDLGNSHSIAIDTVYSGSRIDRTELVQNMTALATTYPTVAAQLTHAGLTRQRYGVLFTTLLNACRTFNGMTWGNPVTPTRLEAKNITFLKTHLQTFDSLVTIATRANPPILGLADCGRMVKALSNSVSPVPQ